MSLAPDLFLAQMWLPALARLWQGFSFIQLPRRCTRRTGDSMLARRRALRSSPASACFVASARAHCGRLPSRRCFGPSEARCAASEARCAASARARSRCSPTLTRRSRRSTTRLKRTLRGLRRERLVLLKCEQARRSDAHIIILSAVVPPVCGNT